MARKTKDVTATAGRDAGKVFRITEKSALDAERWAVRAMAGMARAGIDVSDEAQAAGAAALITEALRSFMSIPSDDVDWLLDSMFECVTRVPDPTQPAITRALIDDDIEEVATRLLLRGEVVELHTGFSVTGALSTLGALGKARAGSPITQTSPSTSEPL